MFCRRTTALKQKDGAQREREEVGRQRRRRRTTIRRICKTEEKEEEEEEKVGKEKLENRGRECQNRVEEAGRRRK